MGTPSPCWGKGWAPAPADNTPIPNRRRSGRAVVTSSPYTGGVTATPWAGMAPDAHAALAGSRPGRARGPLLTGQPAHVSPSPAGWPIRTPTCGSHGARCTASRWSAPSPTTGSALTVSRAAPRTSWWSPSPNPVSVPKPTRHGGAGWVSVLYSWDPLPGGTQHIQGCWDRVVWDFPLPPWCPAKVRRVVSAETPNAALAAPLVGCFPQAPPGSARSWT